MPSERAMQRAREWLTKTQASIRYGIHDTDARRVAAALPSLAALLDSHAAETVAREREGEAMMETCPACGEKYVMPGMLDRALALRKQIEADVAAQEREACAKVADDHDDRHDHAEDGGLPCCGCDIAAAIRRRGEGK